MKIRTECPSRNNKYYNNKAHGGLSDAVNGSPMIKGLTVLDNCVGWANSRFNEIINDPNLEGIVKPFEYQLVCNAENFIESAKKQGLSISPTPIEGGIMVWQKGKTLGSGDGAGHVAVVEEVYADGTILTSESGWNAWAFKNVRRDNSNGRWGQNNLYKFRGCIINPSIVNPKVVPVPPLVEDGIGGANTIRALQRFLCTPQDGEISGQKSSLKKYYPALKAVEYGKGGSVCVRYLQKWLGIKQDGIWGQNTSKALQKKLGVTVDGIFGTNSMKALQRFLNQHDGEKATYPNPKPATTAAKPVTAVKTAGSLVEKARTLAWKKGTPSKTYKWKGGSATGAFKAALKRVFPNRSSWGAAPKKGCSCDVFVGTCVRDAGLDSKYPRGLAQQYTYKPSKFTRKVYKNRKPIDVSKDGDIVIYAKNSKKTKGHTLIRGDGGIYEANLKNYYGHFNSSLSKLKTKRPYVVVLRAK